MVNEHVHEWFALWGADLDAYLSKRLGHKDVQPYSSDANLALALLHDLRTQYALKKHAFWMDGKWHQYYEIFVGYTPEELKGGQGMNVATACCKAWLMWVDSQAEDLTPP